MHLTKVHHDHIARLGVDMPDAAPGAPVAGGEREWRMLYFDPLLATQIASNEGVDTVEMVRPAVRDRVLPPLFARLFACITAPRPTLFRSTQAALVVALRLSASSFVGGRSRVGYRRPV